MLSFNTTLLLLGVCCVVLLVGFSYRDQPWGPWSMLTGVTSLLLLMAWSIINLL